MTGVGALVALSGSAAGETEPDLGFGAEDAWVEVTESLDGDVKTVLYALTSTGEVGGVDVEALLGGQADARFHRGPPVGRR